MSARAIGAGLAVGRTLDEALPSVDELAPAGPARGEPASLRLEPLPGGASRVRGPLPCARRSDPHASVLFASLAARARELAAGAPAALELHGPVLSESLGRVAAMAATLVELDGLEQDARRARRTGALRA